MRFHKVSLVLPPKLFVLKILKPYWGGSHCKIKDQKAAINYDLNLHYLNSH